MPEAGDVRTLARLAGLPLSDSEVEAVLAPLQAVWAARALVDDWLAEAGER